MRGGVVHPTIQRYVIIRKSIIILSLYAPIVIFTDTTLELPVLDRYIIGKISFFEYMYSLHVSGHDTEYFEEANHEKRTSKRWLLYVSDQLGEESNQRLWM